MGYTFVGVLVSGVVLSIAEMAALVPLSGGIVRHADYFVDPALSFAQGWNSIYSQCVGLPAEIVAAAVLIQYWTTISNGLWITILGLLIVATNLFFVRFYGELEFGFSILKVRHISLNFVRLIFLSNHSACPSDYPLESIRSCSS